MPGSSDDRAPMPVREAMARLGITYFTLLRMIYDKHLHIVSVEKGDVERLERVRRQIEQRQPRRPPLQGRP